MCYLILWLALSDWFYCQHMGLYQITTKLFTLLLHLTCIVNKIATEESTYTKNIFMIWVL